MEFEYFLEDYFDYVNKINHTYTTILNGFSATTTYGKLKKLQKAGFDIDITISEVYSEPDYKTLSTDKVESGSGTVTNFVNVYETGIFNSVSFGVGEWFKILLLPLVSSLLVAVTAYITVVKTLRSMV